MFSFFDVLDELLSVVGFCKVACVTSFSARSAKAPTSLRSLSISAAFMKEESVCSFVGSDKRFIPVKRILFTVYSDIIEPMWI